MEKILSLFNRITHHALRFTIIALSLLPLAISLSFAEEKPTSLEEIVVTATRTDKELENAPGSISVITKEDIQKRQVKHIDELVNIISGIYNLNRTHGMESTITLRGFPGQSRTLIMLDGITLNNAYTGGVNFRGTNYPEDLERVEVVKGPFSSLYGGYPMGGVVNFISRMPQKREFTLKTGYGGGFNRDESMDDLRKAYLSYGDKLGDKFSLLISYGYQSTNGYPTNLNVQSTKPPAGVTGYIDTTDNQGNPRYIIGNQGDTKWWDDSFNIKAKYDLSKDTNLSASFIKGRYEYDYESPKTYLRNAANNEVWSYGTVRENTFLPGGGGRTQNIYSLNFETIFKAVKTKLSLSMIDIQKSWSVSTSGYTTATRSGGPGKLTDTPSKAYNADLQFTLPLLDRHILTFGGSFRQGEADTKEHNLTNWKDETSTTTLVYQSKGKDRTYALFLQDEILILNNLTAYIGFRQDWWETFDGYVNQIGTAGYPKNYDSRDASSFSPKAAIVYKPFDKTTLRTSIGKAFRAPTVYDLYRTWTASSGTTYAGNPDLKPETTTSWDLGVEQRLWTGAKANATYFENHIKDMIYRKSVAPTLQENINAGKALIKGVELEAEQRFDKWLRLFANFTYTNAKIKENDAKPSTVGKKLTDVPERMFNTGAELEKGDFTASATGRYISKRYSNDENKDVVNNVYTSYDPYFTADAKVSYKITKNAVVSLSVNNIFDKNYFSYYVMPGRSWFAELTLRF